MNRMLLLGALLLAPALAQAQSVRGVVVEDSTRRPISGVLVEMLTPDSRQAATARTDSAGVFLLLPRRAGDFTIRLAHLGYAPVDSVALLVRPGEAMEIELRMGLRAVPLEPLVVTARTDPRLAAFRERMRRPGFGRFVTRAEIERRPGASASDLLRQLPGVEVVPVAPRAPAGDRRGGAIRPPGAYAIFLRGEGGRCLPTLYIDGMPVKQYAETGVDHLLRPEMLEGVEVYTGAATAPSPLIPLNGCGVVAFWTRSEAQGSAWSWARFARGIGLFAVMVALTTSVNY